MRLLRWGLLNFIGPADKARKMLSQSKSEGVLGENRATSIVADSVGHHVAKVDMTQRLAIYLQS